jgi:hypothetical protein
MKKRGKLSGVILSPTDDYRHISKIRFGKFSHEEFCKDPKRRKELGLPPRLVDSR